MKYCLTRAAVPVDRHQHNDSISDGQNCSKEVAIESIWSNYFKSIPALPLSLPHSLLPADTGVAIEVPALLVVVHVSPAEPAAKNIEKEKNIETIKHEEQIKYSENEGAENRLELSKMKGT